MAATTGGCCEGLITPKSLCPADFGVGPAGCSGMRAFSNRITAGSRAFDPQFVLERAPVTPGCSRGTRNDLIASALDLSSVAQTTMWVARRTRGDDDLFRRDQVLVGVQLGRAWTPPSESEPNRGSVIAIAAKNRPMPF